MMKQCFAVLLLCAAAAFNAAADEKPALNPHLAMLEPLLGKTWKGAFANSKPEKPVVDVIRWERALNGQAVRTLHSINDGVYGGETMFVWVEKKQAVTYYYFTTEGFMTTGTIESKDGHFITSEKVIGDADGITEVRSTSEISPDGKFHVLAEYCKKGKWVLGHEVTYSVDSSATVVFR